MDRRPIQTLSKVSDKDPQRPTGLIGIGEVSPRGAEQVVEGRVVRVDVVFVTSKRGRGTGPGVGFVFQIGGGVGLCPFTNKNQTGLVIPDDPPPLKESWNEAPPSFSFQMDTIVMRVKGRGVELLCPSPLPTTLVGGTHESV